MEKSILISLGDISLEGTLTIPEKAKGLILFVHGSGSSRLSPRNQYVAKELNKSSLATLLIDLLTAGEDTNYETRFDIPFLSRRLMQIIAWIRENPKIKHLPLGLFGASTGAASALEAASILQNEIKAIVSRGGRPDLADQYLAKVTSPTLLIIGGEDDVVITLNQSAFDKLSCKKALEIIPHATHLFEEPGCLEKVAQLAKEWFLFHLSTQNSKHKKAG